MSRRGIQFILCLVSTLIPFGSEQLFAQETSWMEVGFRGAYGRTHSGRFHQYEAYAVHGMNLQFTLSDDWTAKGQWEISAGRLTRDEARAVVLSAGPVLVFRKTGEPWFLELGSRPTIISEHDFDRDQFGGPFQFTSHAGLGISYREMELTYKIQHMSNAGIYRPNDGLDIHVVELGWRFGR